MAPLLLTGQSMDREMNLSESMACDHPPAEHSDVVQRNQSLIAACLERGEPI
ncbi:hypothetical protein KR100_13950 [Synechococcus sp. KORDI-100]|nr:hypothetical protein KR100_13950 [Synechococcus sp. KORDI-100]